MVVNDELIACFVEGKCTPEENSAVRHYLCNHPEEFEHVMLLIDNFKRAPQGNQEYNFAFKKDSTTDIAMSAAAFAPIKARSADQKRNSNSGNRRNSKMADTALRLFDDIEKL